MSETANRMPLALAEQVAAWFIEQCPLNSGLEVVGSVRRRKADVGDLDLIAPMPLGSDFLCAKLETILTRDGALFGSPNAIGRVEQGLKPGFKSCALTIYPALAGAPELVGLQIHRYTPKNRGWVTAVRTGPREFGRDTLVRALKAERLEFADGHICSGGHVVEVADERALFRLARLEWIEPEARR